MTTWVDTPYNEPIDKATLAGDRSHARNLQRRRKGYVRALEDFGATPAQVKELAVAASRYIYQEYGHAPGQVARALTELERALILFRGKEVKDGEQPAV